MKLSILSSCIRLLITSFLGAQTPDLFRLEYTTLPENSSGIQTNRYRALLNVPLKLSKNKNYVILGSEYNSYTFDYTEPLSFATVTIERVQQIDLNLGYTFKWNEDWRVVGMMTPRWASNFESGIEKNDFTLNGVVGIWKEKPDADKPYRLILGLTFNSATGLSFPLPLLNYFKRIHPNWSYTIGVPRADFKYYSPNEKHVFQLATFLDGYFMNIQNDLVVSSSFTAENISLTSIVGITGYQYKISKWVSFYGILGHTLWQKQQIRDANRDQALVLNDRGNIYLRTGFKIGIF